MPYIGNPPAEKYASFEVQHFTTSATTSYTLTHAVANELDIRLVLNNVIQQPGASYAYTASATTLTLSSATTSSDTMYCVYIGKAVQTVAPGAGTVSTTALTDNAVTNAKLADATQGDILYYGASGTPAQLGAGTSGYVLQTQGAGANPVWAVDAAGTITAFTNGADNRVVTATSATALNGEEKLTYDANVLAMIVPDDFASILRMSSNRVLGGEYIGSVEYQWNGTPVCKIMGLSGTDTTNKDDGHLSFFATESGSSIAACERMRISSTGQVSIGTGEIAYSNLVQAGDNGIILTDTSASIIATNTDAPLILARTNADDNNRDILNFNRNGATCGQITGTNSTTTYATSSDYRLKENVDYDFDATTRLKQLKPARFNFIIDETNTLVDGFLAHEVSSIVPEAIIGEKDGIEKNEDGTNKLDNDGNTIPKYQGIDQAKLVPLLVASLQEAITKIETLETKVEALENA